MNNLTVETNKKELKINLTSEYFITSSNSFWPQCHQSKADQSLKFIGQAGLHSDHGWMTGPVMICEHVAAVLLSAQKRI